MSKIEALQGFLKDDSNDSFSRYALAMEYIKIGQYDNGITEFETVIRIDPRYVATYYQLAKVYEQQGRTDEAETTYRNGIVMAGEAGDDHTRDELREALGMLTEAS